MQAAAIRAREEVGEEASVKEARVSSVVISSEEARGSVLTTLSMSDSRGQRRFAINIFVHLFTCPFLPLPYWFPLVSPQ